MRLILGLMLTGAVAGLAGWWAAVFAIPYLETDRMWRQFEAGGAVHNQLSKATVRTAKTAKVVADNPDTLTRSSIIDLANGPVLFEAEIPEGGDYWSISLFAHNTDTYFVANDQDAGAGTYRLWIRMASQAEAPETVDDTAISPSTKSFLIIRAIARDRNDAEAVERLRQQVLASRIVTAN